MTYALKAPTREKLMRVGTANIANVLLKHGFKNVMMHGIFPIDASQPQLVGPAYTLRFMPSREDLDNMTNYSRNDNMHRRAIEECPEGAVLVIDAFGNTKASSMGDMMAARLKYRGVSGVVTDGGYRDSPAIHAVGLPCFQKHNAPPATPIALHPIALNEPVGCGGVAVYPGDIIVGDGDGVVVIPQALVDQVADEALDAFEYESFAALQIQQGHSIFGLFPATEDSRKEYSIWKCAQQQEG
ncbi:ribonuclease activity regulator RraA [Acinetobacter chinensis]|uniref:Ribonuclease activity regulator RraA n=1 Tax=Acinetobacter chinensis TaxID=2004650 RepID=A0A3B7LXL4_9GAMM|nr:ribonuclease activity regulator RraA [Acinetobacter chinensis]AXY57606.1 ribonuclease activity regulator RraA [Acinetobacter chinensis]